jgi:hypothetical protein
MAGGTTKTGMLGTSRLASGGQNPLRAGASGLSSMANGTGSHTGELLFVVLVEFVILALMRKKLQRHHGG